MEEIKETVIWNNTLLDYLIFTGFILFGLLVIKLIKGPILRRLEKATSRTQNQWDNYAVVIFRRFGPPIMTVLLIALAFNYLTLGANIQQIVKIAITILLTFYAVKTISAFIRQLLTVHVQKHRGSEGSVKELYGIMVIINIVIWALGLIFLLDNLGYDVTAIIASLGIGGIAVALAAQNILGDLFNYFVIFFDKPFEVGDFVVIDDKNGVIEYVGLKSTRIKTLSGEQLVFSNSDLTGSRIHNYKKMEKRRVVFSLSINYNTPLETLKKIPTLVRASIESQEHTTFDRCHFKDYGDSALLFETVYYINSSDYNMYMDIQQQLNLQMFNTFKQKEIDFAFPTRSLYIRDQQQYRKKETPAEER